MMSIALLVKPAAWNKPRYRRILDQLVADGAHVAISTTSADLRNELKDLLAVVDDELVLIACGGDGTVHFAINACAGLPVSLCIIPMGTGNDFARYLGLKSPVDGVSALQDGVRQRIDIGVIELSDGTRRHFAGVASCGFDAQVNERANGYRGPQGTAKYVAAIFGELRTLRALRLKMHFDDTTVEQQVTLLAVANTSSYGGGMKICPTANAYDGVFEITCVDEVSRRELVRVLPRVFSGSHVSHPLVTQFTARNVSVSGAQFPVYADGERVGLGPVTISIEPGALSVCVVTSRP
ncbi:MAG: diacylglycerol kinase family protein [Actinomycetes bacterium]